MRKTKKLIFFLTTALLSFPLVIQAAPPAPPVVGTTTTLAGLYTLLISLVNYAFGIILGLAVIYTVWGGFAWLLAGGDEEKVATARGRLTYGVVGIAIIVGVWVIITIVSTFFGVATPGLGT